MQGPLGGGGAGLGERLGPQAATCADKADLVYGGRCLPKREESFINNGRDPFKMLAWHFASILKKEKPHLSSLIL